MKFVRQICICKRDSFFRRGMSPGAGCVVWDCEVWPELKIAEVTITSISYNGCSFKDVIATGE